MTGGFLCLFSVYEAVFYLLAWQGAFYLNGRSFLTSYKKIPQSIMDYGIFLVSPVGFKPTTF